LIFTDPPYNVDYEGYTEEKLKIKGDKMTSEQFQQFLLASFSSYRRIAKPGASMYVCHSSSWQREFQNAMETAGFDVRCQIIWAKNTLAWGFGRYKFQHEPIFYTHVAGQKDPWYGDKLQSTLWNEKKPAANRIHPTAKPVELVERALANSSKAGDVVADDIKRLRDKDKADQAFEELATPIAVYPYRIGSRMTAQHSVFTLHGGKVPVDRYTARAATLLPRPIHLEDINGSVLSTRQFLWKIEIPQRSENHRLKAVAPVTG
jgi:hypothetical protein